MPDVKAITFDYFGTLVDVDRGGATGMARVLDLLGLADADPMAAYLDWDQRAVRIYRGGRYRSYRSVAREALAATLGDLRPDFNDRPDIPDLTEAFLTGLVEDAPAWPEVPEVLEALGRVQRLMPITNMDSDLWARSRLTAPFAQVTTAEMAQAYKPSERIFLKALDTLGLDASEVLHASLSPWADIEGAKPLGFTVAWINRGGDTLGPWTPRPDYEFGDLTGLLRVAG